MEIPDPAEDEEDDELDSLLETFASAVNEEDIEGFDVSRFLLAD